MVKTLKSAFPIAYETEQKHTGAISYKSDMQSSNGKNCTYIKLASSFFETAPGLSILFPSTSNGIPSREGLLNRSCSSFFEIRILSPSAASTTYLACKKQACPIQELHSHSQTVEQNWSKFLSPNPCHVQYTEKSDMY